MGDFNDWNPTATPMCRIPDGRWMAGLEIPHGYHQYLFLMDGACRHSIRQQPEKRGLTVFPKPPRHL